MINSIKIKFACTAIAIGFSVSTLEAQHFDPNNQLLWQITGKGLKKPSYLFGSFHSNDNRLFEFSDSTFSALLHADAVVLEADIYSLFTQYDTRVENTQLKYDVNGNPYTSDKKASPTKYGSEDGRPQFLDAYFQQIAYNSGKLFFPLETVEAQLEAYENITYTNFRDYSINALIFSQENVLNTYLQGDIESMRQLLKTQLAVSGNAYNLLITNRNQIMAAGIDSLCKKHGLFIAVGAAHLAGPEGIIQLLKNKGYTVRQVAATFAEKPTEAELALRKYNTYTYVDSVRNFSAVFGGVPKVDTADGNFVLTYQEMGQGNTFILEIIQPSEKATLKSLLPELFFTPKSAPAKLVLQNGIIEAYEGITFIYGSGDCWRRVFLYENQLFKLTCYGGNKFMNSNRYKTFFDRVKLY